MLEKDLYPPVHDFLEVRFRDRLQPLYGELRTVTAITDTAGGNATGKWSKPDLCTVAFWRQKYGCQWQLDLHGFEVKPAGRCTNESVHEALNHTSHVHYAHLVWHQPKWEEADSRCRGIVERCRRYGVGLITMSDQHDASTYVVRVEADRHSPTGDAVDEFIETRLSESDRAQVASWFEQVR